MTEEKRKEEIGLYEKLASRSKELMDEAREKTAETVDAAIKKAKEEMVVAGDFSHEQGEKFKTFLERDLKTTSVYASKAGEAAKEVLEPHRVAAGLQNTLATILETVGEAFEEWGKKLETDLDFKTGEMTTPGSLTCKGCGEKIRMAETGHIPPCSKCRGTEFHKSY